MTNTFTISTAKKNLITPIYQDGTPISFNKDGWINATDIADKYGKHLYHWLDNKDTQHYMEALAQSLNTRNSVGLESVRDGLVVTKKGRYGGGTWLHPSLAIAFARWLSPELAVWMDQQLLSILSGEWERQRRLTATFHKEMCEELEITRREMDGKNTKSYHYSNEARMLNRILTQGQADSLNRQSLTVEANKALERLERKNGFMIARGWAYQARKVRLEGLYAKEFPKLIDGSIKLLAHQEVA